MRCSAYAFGQVAGARDITNQYVVPCIIFRAEAVIEIVRSRFTQMGHLSVSRYSDHSAFMTGGLRAVFVPKDPGRARACKR